MGRMFPGVVGSLLPRGCIVVTGQGHFPYLHPESGNTTKTIKI